MARRFTDSEIWSQEWFRRLSRDYKLAFFYIKDRCDIAGIWPVSKHNIERDTGVEDFNILKFLEALNSDFNAVTGDKIDRNRVIWVSETEICITNFIQFQNENKKTRKIKPAGLYAKTALEILAGRNLLNDFLDKGYITLSEPFLRVSQGSGVRTRIKEEKEIVKRKNKKFKF